MPPSRERPQNTQVLIVDDHPAQLETIHRILQQEGFETIPCRSVAEGLDQITSKNVGIAVVDLGLQGVTESQFFDQLRENNDQLQIIIYTGKGSFSSAKAAVNSGAFAYLEKARDPTELVSYVHRAMRVILENYAKQLEQTIAKRAQQDAAFGRILDSSFNEFYIICAKTFRIIRASRGALANIGYTLDKLQSMTPLDVMRDMSSKSFESFLHPLQTRASEKVIFETVHQRKDGSQYPVEAHIQLSTFESQQVFVATILDITERKQAEQGHQVRSNQIIQQQKVLLELGKRKSRTLEEALETFTEVTANTLSVERVSVWLFNDERSQIVCQDLFKNSEHLHEKGHILETAQYPKYFHTLEETRALAVPQAQTDPRTNEFTEGYLTPLGITSYLGVPIRRHAKVFGVICHEHTGSERDWTLDEQEFVASVADLVTLTFENWERKQVEEALRDSQDRHSRATAAGKVGVWELDYRLSTFQADSSLKSLLGYEADELSSNPYHWFPLIHSDDRLKAASMATAIVLRKTDQYRGELRMLHKNGTTIWTEVRGSVLRDPKGKALRLVGTTVDITERKQQEALLQAIHQAEAQFITSKAPSQIFEGLLTTFLKLTDSEFGFIGEILFTPEKTPYLKCHAISNIAWNEETLALYERMAPNMEFFNLNTLFGHAITTGQPVIANDPFHDPRRGGLPEGHPPLNAFLGLPIRHGEQLIGMVGMANRPKGYDDSIVTFLQPLVTTCGTLVDAYQNNTRRKEAEEAIKEMNVAFTNAMPGIARVDSQGRYSQVNPMYAHMLGYTPEELIRTTWNPTVHSQDKLLANHAYDQMVKTGKGEFEARAIRKDGTIFHNQVLLVKALGAEDSSTGYHCFMRDITERKEAEEKLRLWATIFKWTQMGVAASRGTSGVFEIVNPSYARMHGYSTEELIGQPIATVFPPELRGEVPTYIRLVHEQGFHSFESKHIRKDGTDFPVWVTVSGIEIEDGEPVLLVASVVDITDRKQAEEALHDTHERLQVLSQHLLTLQENERRQLARDLHDEIGQTLTAVKLNLQTLQQDSQFMKAPGILRDSLQILDSMLKHVRELSLDLRPSMLDDLGLVAAVRWFVSRQAERAGWIADIHIDEDLPQLSPDQATASFRVIQEALTNVMRHAQASHIQVEIHINQENLEVRVYDNGVGFDSLNAMEQSAAGQGFGLLSMLERVRMLDGRLIITSQRGQGTQVLARFPIKVVAPTSHFP